MNTQKIYPATKSFPSNRIYCYNNCTAFHCFTVAEEIATNYQKINIRLAAKEPCISTKYTTIDLRVVKNFEGNYYIEDHSIWKNIFTGEVYHP